MHVIKGTQEITKLDLLLSIINELGLVANEGDDFAKVGLEFLQLTINVLPVFKVCFFVYYPSLK